MIQLRWRVRHSVLEPGKWLVYAHRGMYVKGKPQYFETWDEAMDYVNRKVFWRAWLDLASKI